MVLEEAIDENYEPTEDGEKKVQHCRLTLASIMKLLIASNQSSSNMLTPLNLKKINTPCSSS